MEGISQDLNHLQTPLQKQIGTFNLEQNVETLQSYGIACSMHIGVKVFVKWYPTRPLEKNSLFQRGTLK